LLIGSSFGLHGPANDVNGLERELIHRGFDGVKSLVGSSLLRDQVLTKVGDAAAESKCAEDLDLFLAQYSGHGRGGRLILGPSDSVSVKTLIDELSKIRARQILFILDACRMVEATREIQIPPNMQILFGHDPSDCVREDPAATVYASGGAVGREYRGLVTNALLRLLDTNRGDVRLDSTIMDLFGDRVHILQASMLSSQVGHGGSDLADYPRLEGANIQLDLIGPTTIIPRWVC
jgi:hypothetical protein